MTNLQTWWKAWSQLIRKLIALVASFASIVGVLLYFLPQPSELPVWSVALLICAAFFLVVVVVFEFLDHRGRRVYSKSDAQGVREYMHNWIKHGGRVVIWTRDMSWAQNPETRGLLTEKAERKELILCLPEANALAVEMEKAGAEVCTYGKEHLESSASRFTMTFFNRDGSRIAVGRAEGDSHVIDEFSAGDHPAFHLAADLIMLVRSLSGRQK